MMRVLFFGNHTVGVCVLKRLIELTDVVGVVAHPLDPEDGVRYESVHNFCVLNSINVIRGKATNEKVKTFVAQCKADLIWVTDYRYLLPLDVLQYSNKGAINFHPSLLPAYRGRAPLNWAIINGEVKTGLTAHFIDEGTDTGDIIIQESIDILPYEDIGDILKKLYPLYTSFTDRVISYVLKGKVPRMPQDDRFASTFPARKPEDGKINWSLTSNSILNLIRGVTKPYPGAFTHLGEEKIFFWKAKTLCEERVQKKKPGVILEVCEDKSLLVECSDAILHVTEWSCNSRELIVLKCDDHFL
jgi:methionyl-tRNA formyltransferase